MAHVPARQLRGLAPPAQTADWSGVGALVGALARETTVKGLADAYLRGANALIPAAAYGVYLFDPATAVVDYRATRNVSDYVLAVYEERGRAVDPLMRHLVIHGQPASSAQLLSPQQWQSDPMYAICQLQRFDHKVEAPIVASGRMVGSLHFAFAEEHGEPAAGAAQLAGALGLLLGGMLGAAVHHDALRRERDGLRAGLELSSEALVITDLRHGERRANRAARALLEQLRATDPRFRLDSVLAEAHEQGREGVARIPVQLASGKGALLLRSVRDAEDPDLVATALELEDRSNTQLPAHVEQLLTPREVEVARLVATGSTNAEIASELHLSQYTIKEYVASVYRKTKAKSRVDLARLARPSA